MCDVNNSTPIREIDDDFYSRQRYVIGDEAMCRLSNSTVLIYGLCGVGVEIAKNLALAGVKRLILDDSTICTTNDLATQFYIRPENIKRGDTRAKASLPHLSALNPYVRVVLLDCPLTESNVDILDVLKNKFPDNITCVVATDCNLVFAALLNNYCRQRNIKFVYANTIGVLGNIFCDFGENILYGPPDEEPPVNFFIGHIENAEKPKLLVKDSEQHKLTDGSYVTFHEISGMTELNGMTVQVKEISPKVLELDVDTRKFGVFTGSGVATEFKASPPVFHLPLAMQLENPKLCTVDLVDPESALQLHTSFVALMMFFCREKRLPRAWCKKDLNLYHQIARRFAPPNTNIDAQLLSKICVTAQGQVPPLCSFFGGLAAQEVIKAVTCRFTPLNQWLYLGVDCLVPKKVHKSSLLLSARSRYWPLVACIGSDNMEKLSMASALMVGCGAIGCELLKNLALIGFAGDDFHRSALYSNSSNSVPNGDALTFATLSSSSSDSEDSLGVADVNNFTPEDTGQLFFRDTHHLALELMRLGQDEDIFALNQGDVLLGPRLEADFNETDLLRLPFMLRSNLNVGTSDSFTSVQVEPTAFDTNGNASIHRPCITITDNDHIEKSNLNRQFLFCPEHVGMSKSQVAAESILKFNPAMKVVPLTHKFCADTSETLFTDKYIQVAASGVEMSSPPVVLAALDNVEARQYLDQRCVVNRLAMFDSGTQGTKGHTQAILPGITESYSNQSDPGSDGADAIPYCTLKSFPAKPVDCVEWAREKFFSQFTLKPQNLSFLFADFNNSSNCLQSALQSALNLLHRFPPDFTTDRGDLFWQLPRRKPTPQTFDIKNSLHVEFVWSFTRLLCLQSGMPPPSRTLGEFEWFTLNSVLKHFTSKPYIPSNKEVIIDPTLQKPNKAANEGCSTLDNNLQDALHKAIETLSKLADDLLVCQPIVFDKDNEEEGHVDFISAAANLRAVMYGLPVTDRYEVKRIAGRIIPAIATTTATVAGLVSLEVIKYICFSGGDDNSVSKECLANEARNNFINLSLPSVLSVRPGLCDATKLPNGEAFTIWDRWDYKLPSRSTTMQDFISDLKVKHRLDVSLITKGSDPVFISMMQPYMSRLKNPFIQELKVLPEDKYVDLVVIFEGGDGMDEDVAGPPFRVILPQNE
nr:ubiquitin modifier activating enzyme 6 [Hymenolepis microstoma]